MYKPYKIIFLVSTLLTIFLFSLDKGPWMFTLPSVIGYVIVGSLYIAGIGVALSAIYFVANVLFKLGSGNQ